MTDAGEVWPPGGGTMGDLVWDYDWSGTPLGPIAHWPASLRVMAGSVLASSFPMLLAWGPYLTCIYNDAYCPLLGNKTEALGRPLLEVWSEVRDDIAPLVEKACVGETSHVVGARFTITRDGFPEDAYFDYGIGPVWDETGTVAGILGIGVETTKRSGVETALQESKDRLRALLMFRSNDIMARAFLLVLDSVGIGGAPDAAAFGDAGADTVGHIAEACGRLDLPNLAAMGLGEACRLATGRMPPGLELHGPPTAAFGCAAERSRGKDTPSGHWELAGVPVEFDWGLFPERERSFPPELIAALCAEAGLPGILGDCHASGTTIVAELGAEHLRTGKPICYTSADSVFQIAAHEEAFGLQRLYEVCAIARRRLDPLRVGRVIARPFLGTPEAGFRRTENRRDLTVPPPAPTLLETAAAAGRQVISVGKIADIFAHVGTGTVLKAPDDAGLVARTLEGMQTLEDGGLLVANYVDFDSLYGHRRDVAGYAAALQAFDAMVPELRAAMRPGDSLYLTADHGCDPTWPGSDHTREQIPVLACGDRLHPGSLGRRSSFADVAAAIAARLDLPRPASGTGF